MVNSAITFQYWQEGFIFIGIFAVVVGLPCFAVTVLGTKLINHLGRYPSKSATSQMNVCIKLLAVELFSFGLLAGVFHFFS